MGSQRLPAYQMGNGAAHFLHVEEKYMPRPASTPAETTTMVFCAPPH
uniref:Uncharacterized protein n=1 Tax=Anguilla anguilla TaxID=7936 RepID=A0A0E9U6J5_ANGAN